MIVKITSRMAGPLFNYSPGHVVEVDEKFGKALIEAGSAERVDPEGDAPQKITEQEVDFSGMTKAEIKELLDDKEIEYTERMTKADLIDLLEG